MKSEFEQFQRIENYLKGRLSPQAKVDFEHLIQADPALAIMVREHQLIHEVIVDRGLLDVRQKLKDLDTNSGGTGSNGFWYTITFLIVCISGTMLYYGLKKQSPERSVAVVKPIEHRAPEPEGNRGKQEKSPSSSPNSTKKVVTKAFVPATDTVDIVTDSMDTIDVKAQFIVPPPVELETGGEISIGKADTNEPCVLSGSQLEITTAPSCTGNPSGKILIGQKSDFKGQPPFSFSINGEDFYRSGSFYNVAPGKYFVSVKDAHGCVWRDTSQFIVSEEDCRSNEYAFNPKYGEKWIIPLDNETEGRLEIYNRSGSLVYSTQIVNGYPDSWDGTGSGDVLPMGNYSYVLTTTSKKATGHVTIVR